jgi:hypothetical protein
VPNYQVGDLTMINVGGSQATTSNPFAHDLTAASKSYRGGSSVGTRSFALGFIRGGQGTYTFLDNYGIGQASVNFGLHNTLGALDLTGQSQAGDLDSSDLGHFLTINVTPDNPVPPPTSVNEPFTVALLAFGLAGVGFARRRSK